MYGPSDIVDMMVEGALRGNRVQEPDGWVRLVSKCLIITITHCSYFDVQSINWCTVSVLYIFICSCNCFIPMLLATPMSMYSTQQNQALVLYLHSVRRCDSTIQLSLPTLASINCLILQNAIHPKQ